VTPADAAEHLRAADALIVGTSLQRPDPGGAPRIDRDRAAALVAAARAAREET
jgi:predicted TIM-barrel enzyme